MAPHLAPFPYFVFAVFEPLSLIAGITAALLQPRTFIYGQLPSYPTPDPSTPIPATEQILALQLGNMYLLLTIIGVLVLNNPVDRAVVRLYLTALWFGDVGHIAATAFVMGTADFVNVHAWTSTVWGNVGGTIALWLVRSAWLAGYWNDQERGRSLKRRESKEGSRSR